MKQLKQWYAQQKMQPTNKDELLLAMYTVHHVHVASMHNVACKLGNEPMGP